MKRRLGARRVSVEGIHVRSFSGDARAQSNIIVQPLQVSCRGTYYPIVPCTVPCFTSNVERDLVTSDIENYSNPVDIAQIKTFSLLVLNHGSNPVVVQPQLSPDNIVWDSFEELSYVIGGGESRLLVPQYFLRFVRVKYQNYILGSSTVITVWFQGQS